MQSEPTHSAVHNSHFGSKLHCFVAIIVLIYLFSNKGNKRPTSVGFKLKEATDDGDSDLL